MTAPTQTGYAAVNGLEIYYEIHGDGAPLVLLHGGVAASEAFGANLPALAAHRRVVAVHHQGHGHTRDIDRPFSAEAMADDVAGLIAHLGLQKADVLGYSLGAGVALQVAIRHPQLVGKLVVVSVPMASDGYYPELVQAFESMPAQAAQIAAGVKPSPLGQLYPHVDWTSVFTKIGQMHQHGYDWSKDVAAITSPTLLIFADADAQRPEHIVAFYKALGGGQRPGGIDGSGRPKSRLAILPGTTHYDLLATTAVADAAIAFLDAPARP